MTEPHTASADEVGATEIARLVALVEAIDEDLTGRGVVKHNGEPRGVVEVRLRASQRLAEWLDR